MRIGAAAASAADITGAIDRMEHRAARRLVLEKIGAGEEVGQLSVPPDSVPVIQPKVDARSRELGDVLVEQRHVLKLAIGRAGLQRNAERIGEREVCPAGVDGRLQTATE